MSFITGNSNTYSCDLKLFSKLGLTPFSINTREKVEVGEYKLPDHEKAVVKIFVTAAPAQFWSFDIKTDEGNDCIINTGSGALSDYWGSIMLVATDMMILKIK